MRKLALLVFLLSMLSLPLSACTGKAADLAAKAVDDYLNALDSKDSTKLSALSCASWESSALLELDSLQAVKTRLDAVSCKTTGNSGGISQVNCQGRILATYNGEDQALDISTRTYQVVQKGGNYLVCGYK